MVSACDRAENMEGRQKVKREKKQIKLFQSIIIIISRRIFSIGFPWKRERERERENVFHGLLFFSSPERNKRGVN
jgi:hypothetical protein